MLSGCGAPTYAHAPKHPMRRGRGRNVLGNIFHFMHQPRMCGETHLRTALSVIDRHWVLRRQLTLATNLNHDGLGRVNREDRVAGLGLWLGRQPCIRVATAARDYALHLIWAGAFGRAVVAILPAVPARPVLIEHTEPRDLDIGPGLGQRLSAQQKCPEGCSSPHSCQESVQQPCIVVVNV